MYFAVIVDGVFISLSKRSTNTAVINVFHRSDWNSKDSSSGQRVFCYAIFRVNSKNIWMPAVLSPSLSQPILDNFYLRQENVPHISPFQLQIDVQWLMKCPSQEMRTPFVRFISTPLYSWSDSENLP